MTIASGAPGAAALAGADRAAALASVKAQLHVTGSDEDALIGDLAEAAIGLAERFTGQIAIAREMIAVVAASTHWQRIAAAPVSAISAVAAFGADEAPRPLAVDDYAIDIDAAGEGWVRVIGETGGRRLAVTLEAGLAADWASLPAPFRQGVVMLAAHLYSARDDRAAPPAAVTALWRPWRRLTLGAGATA